MRKIFHPWIWKMALRDGRYGLRKLMLSMSCVILGVASYTAVASFAANLERTVAGQSKTLLGADLSLRGRQPFSKEAEALFRELGGEQSREIRFSSMAYFPDSGKSRLVQVRALKGKFPYYGALETEPGSAGRALQSGPNALVDETLMIQYGAGVGDQIRIGEQKFRITGKLRKIPGESIAFSLVSPRVYVPLAYLDRSELLQKGSIVRYRVYFKFDPPIDAERLVSNNASRIAQLELRAETVAARRARISRTTDNLSRYLQLAGFIAVLLAGIGVASGIHVYVKEKVATVAVLRCIGAGSGGTVAVYLIQALAIGVSGSLLGALLGLTMQRWVPQVLQDFLPFEIPSSFAPGPLLAGLTVGAATALLFSLLPLAPLRRVSPLLALRLSYEPTGGKRDPLLWAILGLMLAAVAAFAFAHLGIWRHALWFTAVVAGVFGLLFGLALGMTSLVRKLVPSSWSYPWRQGLANLFRPANQTVAVMLSLGLGTFLLMTLYLGQTMLLEHVALRTGRNNPNIVLFDVQKDQKAGVLKLLDSFRLPRTEEVPVVTMRIAGVEGTDVEELRRERSTRRRDWALRREYRSTYRDHLSDTEEIVAGGWPAAANGPSDSIPVSLEKEIAAALGVGVGDTLAFDVQGVSLRARVAAIREVDWQRVQPNFFVVFPRGVLEDAPQFYAFSTRAQSRELSAAVQRAVVERFPGVSIIDISLALATLDAILGRISQAVRFMAGFTILTGLAVLAGAVLNSQAQRVRESIVLRALGASSAQITGIIVAEYFFLGAIAAMAGVILAIAGSWGLTFYFLGAAPSVPPGAALLAIALVTGLTVAAGVLSGRGALTRPALEALRAES